MMEIKIPTRREWYPCPYCGQHLLVYADTAVCSGLYGFIETFTGIFHSQH